MESDRQMGSDSDAAAAGGGSNKNKNNEDRPVIRRLSSMAALPTAAVPLQLQLEGKVIHGAQQLRIGVREERRRVSLSAGTGRRPKSAVSPGNRLLRIATKKKKSPVRASSRKVRQIHANQGPPRLMTRLHQRQ